MATSQHQNGPSMNGGNYYNDAAAQQQQQFSNTNAQAVGDQFQRQYYDILNKQPQDLYRFYTDQSRMTVVHIHDTASPPDVSATSGQMGIYELVSKAEFAGCQPRLTSMQAQPSQNEGITVSILGHVHFKGAKWSFTQTFFLAVQEKGYFVLNDIAHYRKESQDNSASTVAQPSFGTKGQQGQANGAYAPRPAPSAASTAAAPQTHMDGPSQQISRQQAPTPAAPTTQHATPTAQPAQQSYAGPPHQQQQAPQHQAPQQSSSSQATALAREATSAAAAAPSRQQPAAAAPAAPQTAPLKPAPSQQESQAPAAAAPAPSKPQPPAAPAAEAAQAPAAAAAQDKPAASATSARAAAEQPTASQAAAAVTAPEPVAAEAPAAPSPQKEPANLTYAERVRLGQKKAAENKAAAPAAATSETPAPQPTRRPQPQLTSQQPATSFPTSAPAQDDTGDAAGASGAADEAVSSIFVKNLPQNVTTEKLFNTFQQYGTIKGGMKGVSLRNTRNQNNQPPREGQARDVVAFIDFTEPAAMSAAIAASVFIDDQKVHVSEKRPFEQKPRYPGQMNQGRGGRGPPRGGRSFNERGRGRSDGPGRGFEGRPSTGGRGDGPDGGYRGGRGGRDGAGRGPRGGRTGGRGNAAGGQSREAAPATGPS